MTSNSFRTAALMAVLITLIALIGYAVGGPNAMLIAFFFAVAMNFASYWFSDKIILKMYRAREVSRQEAPELYDMVDRLRQRAGMPMPKVVVIPSDQPNAFATGRNPKNGVVAVTSGIVRQLTKRELEGVIAHELAHIQNRDILTASIAATLASAITLLARFAVFVPIGNRDGNGGNALATILMLILAPIAAFLIQMAISRAREYVADEDGGRICGDPNALADALVRLHQGAAARPMDANPSTAHLFIVNPLAGRMQGIANLFSTHPPMEERVRRLRAQAAGMR